MIVKAHRIKGGKEAYRVKLSAKLISALGWSKYESNFECYGVFRADGELLCAAKDLTNSSGVHPFEPALVYLDDLDDSAVESLRDIPPARVIAAADRVIEFEAAWSSTKRNQLELRLTNMVTQKLGWKAGNFPFPPLYGFSYGGVLVLLSKERYIAVNNEDFTGGELNL